MAGGDVFVFKNCFVHCVGFTSTQTDPEKDAPLHRAHSTRAKKYQHWSEQTCRQDVDLYLGQFTP